MTVPPGSVFPISTTQGFDRLGTHRDRDGRQRTAVPMGLLREDTGDRPHARRHLRVREHVGVGSTAVPQRGRSRQGRTGSSTEPTTVTVEPDGRRHAAGRVEEVAGTSSRGRSTGPERAGSGRRVVRGLVTLQLRGSACASPSTPPPPLVGPTCVEAPGSGERRGADKSVEPREGSRGGALHVQTRPVSAPAGARVPCSTGRVPDLNSPANSDPGHLGRRV